MSLKPINNCNNYYVLAIIFVMFFWSNISAAENRQLILSKYSTTNQYNPPPLRIAVTHFQPPFVMQGSNRDLSGFDIDLMLHICKDLHRTCKFVPMRSSQILKAVSSEKVDVGLGGIDIGKINHKNIIYTVPYMLSEYRLLSNKYQHENYKELSAIKNKRVGIIQNSLAKSSFQQFAISNNIRLVEYNDISKLISDLLQNKVDMAVVQSATANYWQNNSSNQLSIQSKPINLGMGIGIPVYSNNISLVNDINISITKYKTSTEYKQLYKIYFGDFS